MSRYQPLWEPPTEAALARGAAAITRARRLGGTPRERAYIEALGAFYDGWQTRDHAARALAFERAMRGVHERYPDDVDAAAFYALALLSTAPPEDKTYTQQQKAARIVRRVLEVSPEHPGAMHYGIHAYDYPKLAERGLDLALRYDAIAPDVPHALHMPTHLFTRRGLWSESIALNRRSADVARRHPVDGALSMHYVHALDYIVYAYLQLGDDAAAAATVAELRSAEQRAQASLPAAYAVAAMPARLALERGDWLAASRLALPEDTGLDWSLYPAAEAVVVFARGLGAARVGELAVAERSSRRLAALRARADDYWGTQIEVQRLTVDAWREQAGGDPRRARDLMTEAAALEARIDKHPTMPGWILPAPELLGDLLLAQGLPAEAARAYGRALDESPRRFRSVFGAGRAAELHGDLARARERYQALLTMTTARGEPRPELTHARRFLARTAVPGDRQRPRR